ncbi:hypothetical protein MUA77_12720 [Mammaliicoccus sciuri]|uniref:hypothetical protein n=1 Tax=Mammaliicoccus sciuri TaxID=1296 RepID=UPI001E596421|nr:hypothetical protein [Mammaliicoccus sciuri]MCD8794991.1 hypothetical protein [Mammaliicoccus sciuri]MCJ0950834.1 hypothetical protein [Mammaliicoccus sciuri]UXU83649.1 hypothetical protein MUA77_12720 [Mammaliicoccus sciuri]UXU93496.1 hypothetical protein MUA42_12730 [Mammaliicoccus sciuri]UXV15444.1 hypothetical protein MUA89_12990 [Mammaliicoccus sciuri]
MKKNFKKVTTSLLIASVIGLGSSTAFAASFGNASSGASSNESMQIKYNGAAWNYSKSKYKSTSFKYARNGRTLMSKTAYNGKVTGSVWDDVRWGDKYNTKFTWSRG